MTEFSYRYSSLTSSTASIFTSFLLGSKSASGPTPDERKKAVDGLIEAMGKSGMEAEDLSNDEMSKDHARYMLGGKVVIQDERVFRFGESTGCQMERESR